MQSNSCMWYVDSSPPLIVKLVLFILTSIIIWLIGFLIKRNLDNISQKQNFEAKNVIKLIISVTQVTIIAFAFTFLFEIQSSTILSFSALFGTTIGFGLAVAIGNIVAGFYLISMRPFGIGDFIRVGSTEGIVLEIGLNYTKILQPDTTLVLIPNKTLLDANLLNCSLSIKDLEARNKMGHTINYEQRQSELQKKMKKIKRKNKNTRSVTDVVDIITTQKFTRYPFTLQLKVNVITPQIPLSAVNERMSDVCDRWGEKLGFRPRYYYGKNIFRQDMQIVMVVSEPSDILQKQSEFIEDIYQTVFVEIHNGGS